MVFGKSPDPGEGSTGHFGSTSEPPGCDVREELRREFRQSVDRGFRQESFPRSGETNIFLNDQITLVASSSFFRAAVGPTVLSIFMQAFLLIRGKVL